MPLSIDPTTIAIIAVFLGVISRILWPYWKKVTDTPEGQPKPTFDYKFAITGLEVIIEGVIVVGQILPAFLETVTEPTGSILMLFLLGFNYGWARTDINNRIVT